MAQRLGGDVEPADNREYGKADIEVTDASAKLFHDLPKDQTVWMSHGDLVTRVPDGFRTTATSVNCPISAMDDDDRKFYGIQFHAEVQNTQYGHEILHHFAFDVCHAEANWSMDDFITKQIAKSGPKSVTNAFSSASPAGSTHLLSAFCYTKQSAPS